MGKQSRTNPQSHFDFRGLFALAAMLSVWLLAAIPLASQTATAVPLVLPSGLAYDSAGNLFFAESGRHLIRRLSVAGALTTIAGTGTQGFAGDGGPAAAALLDAPTALALDGAGDIFFSDSHNRHIRRIDAVSGTITTVASPAEASALAVSATGDVYFADPIDRQVRRVDHATGTVTVVAGTGVQGSSGDGGPALAATLDTPSGVALSPAGDVFVADAHEHRIRRIDHTTGLISTVAATFGLPLGLAVDSTGALLFTDEALQQLLYISASSTTPSITALAGTGVQGFSGDGGPATLAALDTPLAVTLSPAGLVTFTDSANGRIRQIDAAGIIHTLAGAGASASASLTLAAPSVLLYGTGTVTATLAASPAAGQVTLYDGENPTAPQTIASAPLSGNAASFSAASLSAGAHRLFAIYSGDTLHAAAQSSSVSLTVSPAAATASPAAVSLVYGQPVPVLSGALTGILAQDSALVSLALTTSAAALSPPAAYPIAATLTGPAAGNYILTTVPAAVTIAKAPAAVTLNLTASPSLSVQVASTTAGLPTGSVTLLDGATAYASATLSGGTAVFGAQNLTPGSHTLTAAYSGDTDFLSSASAPGQLTVASPALPDFTLAPVSQTSVTVPAGSAAQYSFTVTPVNGALASPILLAASGLPTGATATFNPAYLPPSGAPSSFVLTITTPKASLVPPAVFGPRVPPYVFAVFLPLFLLARRRPRRLLLLLAATLTLGCGDRINNTAAAVTTTSYTITVTATATQATGAAVQHTTTVILGIQQ